MSRSSQSQSISRPLLSGTFLPGRVERLFVAIMDRLQWGQLTIQMPSGNSHNLKGARDDAEGQQFHANINLKSYKAIRRIMRSGVAPRLSAASSRVTLLCCNPATAARTT